MFLAVLLPNFYARLEVAMFFNTVIMEKADFSLTTDSENLE